jgi:hypothetical protein
MFMAFGLRPSDARWLVKDGMGHNADIELTVANKLPCGVDGAAM